jgi:hypothetical protein
MEEIPRIMLVIRAVQRASKAKKGERIVRASPPPGNEMDTLADIT